MENKDGIRQREKELCNVLLTRLGAVGSAMASNDLAMSHPTIMSTPSSKESDSTVSHFTEAKSEMKEMDEEEEEGAITPRQTYFMCYATDLLGSFEQIKKRGLSGARAVEDLCVMIKARVAVEETYAKGLEKVASQVFREELEPGSFREALEALRADLLNKAVQHRQLAKNLSTDVVEPLSELKTWLGAKIKALVAGAGKVQRDTRVFDERYRRSYAKYARCHREAASCLTAAVEGGAVPRTDPRGRLSPTRGRTATASTKSPSRSPVSSSGGRVSAGASPTTSGSTPQPSNDTSGVDDDSGGCASTAPTSSPASNPHPEQGTPAPLIAITRRRAMSATLDKVREAMPSANHNKKDLVQWFLPSDKHRKEGLIEAAHVAAEAAEETRRTCLANWKALRSALHVAVQDFQRFLTDFQGCEEQLVSEAQNGMRKHAVFESSTLANQQYDVQMLSKVMEAVNVEMDLRNFIRAARREVSSDPAVMAQAAEAAEAEATQGDALAAGAAPGVMGGMSMTGTSVLLNGGNSQALAVVFENLFGVGPHLPAPPTDEPWSPPETAGEMPLVSKQELEDLYRVPLMSKADISKYLDATDPVAGAAASEAAAAAIKALSEAASGTEEGDKESMDELADSALGNLPSHYPMVTPAASVFEILAFAHQARDGKDLTPKQGQPVGSDGESPGGEQGQGTAAATPTSPAFGGDDQAGGESVRLGGSESIGAEARVGIGAGGIGDEGYEASPEAVPSGTGSPGPEARDGKPRALVASASPESAGRVEPGVAGEEVEPSSATEGGGAKLEWSEYISGSASAVGGDSSESGGTRRRRTRGHSGGGSGGVVAVFAAAAAAFGAADAAIRQSGERHFTISRSRSSEISTQGKSGGRDTGTVDGGASATEQIADPKGTVRGAPGQIGESPTLEAAPAGPDEAKAGLSSFDVGMAVKHVDTSHHTEQANGTPSASASALASVSASASESAPASGSASGSASASAMSSPCLELATRRPYVFAATLADDVLETLAAEGAAEHTEGVVHGGDSSEAGGDRDGGKSGEDPEAVVARAVEALFRYERGAGVGGGAEAAAVDAAEKFFANSPYASHQLLLALCTRACKAAPADESTTSYTGRMRALLGTGKGRANDEGFAPVGLSPRSYRALARLLRASLDQAAAGKEFLLARSCLVTSGLFAVNGAEYLEWLRAEEAAGSLGREKDELLEAMADVELVSAATSSGGGESTAGGGGGGVGFLNAVGKTPASSGRRTGDYVLQRELRRHPVWATIELWEVALSDSVVIATEGGGARAERWLPAETLSSLKKRFGDHDKAGRQLDVKLGQLAFLGYSMLVCGLPPLEVRSTLRKCSSLAMEIPSPDLSALMALLDRFVMGPSSTSGLQEGTLVARSHGVDRFPTEETERGARRRGYSDVDDDEEDEEEEEEEDSTSPSSSGSSVASSFSVPSSATDPEGEDDDDDSEDGMAAR